MMQVFADCFRQAERQGGGRHYIRLWRFAIVDLVLAAAKERGAQLCAENYLRLKMIMTVLVALMLAAFTGWIDINNTDVQPAAACILSFTFGLSLFRPGSWWFWALVVGLSIPAAHALVRLVGMHLPYQVDGFATTFVALIPAFIGSGSGAFIRMLVGPWSHRGVKPST